MDKEKKKQYLENNNRITELLSENELLLREEGYNPPVNNFAVNGGDKIKIPPGYIRTAKDFLKDYHLTELVLENNTKKNISYALQLSDLYNFIINRFHIWGSIETMLYKQMFINIVSIIEALILECINRIDDGCVECRKAGKCQNKINRYTRGNMKQAAEKLYQIGVLSFSKETFERLMELYDYRNKIHIRLNEQNEYLDDKFNLHLYNESIEMLKLVDATLYENAVSLYGSCMGFIKKEGKTN